MAINIQAVIDLIEETARTLVMPRFSRLTAADIQAKTTPGAPEDLVTIVDREVEAHLSRALRQISSSAMVIGEEATDQRPELLGLLASDQPLWIIDPIDGTKNFAAGDSDFGIMVAYVVAGTAQVAWLVLPARRETFVAEIGNGAFLNGGRIRIPSMPLESRLRGTALVRYMPPGLAQTVKAALNDRVQIRPSSGCAAVNYTDIPKGLADFVIYYRLMPWDHAAPALILSEAGGYVGHFSGKPYTARSDNQLTIVARDVATADQLRAWLRPHMPPES